ncbi:MAG: DUF4279 domain-containing protein [Deltaproteobacteria bacterium]|nr:DUF4279 domain-containing protein [Deltaproteobacteria bacterium]
MSTENFVRLIIISDLLEPEQIDDITGMKCDKSWRKNDFRAKSIIREKNFGWMLESNLERTDDIELHIENIFQRLEGHIEKVKSLSERNIVKLSLAIYSEDIPALYFNKETIFRLSTLGAALDIDLYLIGEER